jgi:hypothetical protein
LREVAKPRWFQGSFKRLSYLSFGTASRKQIRSFLSQTSLRFFV